MARGTKPLLDRIYEFLWRVDAKLGVDKALLFGSTAKRSRLQESDVDLIVVSKAFYGMPVPERLGILQKEWDNQEELQALAYTPEEFCVVSQRLTMKEILSYAIELTDTQSNVKPSNHNSKLHLEDPG